MRDDTENSFEQSHRLSQQQVDDAVSPHELTAILDEGGIKYVLIGGHVLGYLTGAPRATVDVDRELAMQDLAELGNHSGGRLGATGFRS
jgi:hypothetical protein